MAARVLEHRPPPEPVIKDYDPRLKSNPDVKKWLREYLGDPMAGPGDVDEPTLRFFIEQAQGGQWNGFERTCYERAMEATTPVLSFPKLGGYVDTMEHVSRQPEFQSFWASWSAPRRNNEYERLALEGTKAVMTTMAIPRSAMHALNAHELLDDDRENKQFLEPLLNVFTDLSGGRFALPPYKTMMPHLQQPIAVNCQAAAEVATIKVLKTLRALMPDAGIGQRWLIDGTMVPGWAPQHGAGRRIMPEGLKGVAKDVWEEREKARQLRVEGLLRQYAKDFGFRYLRAGRSRKDLEPDDISSADVRSGKVKAWRGLYHVALVEQATGLAAVWLTFDASYDEAAALLPLLSRLFELWPELDEIKNKMLAADSAWDEDQFVRACQLDYGIDAIFRWHPKNGGDKPSKRHQLPNGATRNGQIQERDSHGHLICPVHDTRMNFKKWNAASRNGLRPGESSDERDFRVHAECLKIDPRSGQICGGRTMQVKNAWCEVTNFPHYSDGVPGRYFMRTAMLGRLNQIESVWSALKSAGLATPGAARRRISHGVTYGALLSLMHLMRACLVLADQRQHNGLAPYGGPNAPRTARIPTRHARHYQKPRRGSSTRVISRPKTRDATADLIRNRGRAPTPRSSGPSWAP